MPFEPLKNEDLALVNRLLNAHPDLRDTISVIRQVNANSKYPITSFDELAQAMGGENASLTFRGRTMTMADARSVIPAYYFPIASESDLAAKMADLSKALPAMGTTVRVPPVETAMRLTAATAVKPEGITAPHLNMDEVLKISGFGHGAPAIGGTPKQ